GIPSVFTISGVAAEFIEHDKNAFVIAHKNSGQISDAVLYLLENSAKAKELSARGREDVIKRFDLQRMIDKTQSLYL
ncbi:MAG: glycosyltransferase, partial [Bacteroidia bacterium]|nr:glycosyltransferase [Bacteroidia bacterium]